MNAIYEVIDRHPNGIMSAVGSKSRSNRANVGKWVFYTPQGRILESGVYGHDGQRSGDWTVYDWDAGMIFRETYVSGVKTRRIRVARITTKSMSGAPDALREAIERLNNLYSRIALYS